MLVQLRVVERERKKERQTNYLPTRPSNQPTNSMDKSPYDTDSCSASREISRLLWSCVYKSPPVFPVMSQILPVCIIPPYFLKIRSGIILPSSPRSSKLSLSFKFSNQNFVRTTKGRNIEEVKSDRMKEEIKTEGNKYMKKLKSE